MHLYMIERRADGSLGVSEAPPVPPMEPQRLLEELTARAPEFARSLPDNLRWCGFALAVGTWCVWIDPHGDPLDAELKVLDAAAQLLSERPDRTEGRMHIVQLSGGAEAALMHERGVRDATDRFTFMTSSNGHYLGMALRGLVEAVAIFRPVEGSTASTALAAAVRDAETTIHGFEDPLGGKVARVGAPAWIIEALERHNAAVANGGGRACPHLALPQARVVALWEPGRVVCVPCAGDGALLPSDETANWTCDRCHRFPRSEIALSVIQAGAFLVWYGLCRTCREEVRAQHVEA